MLLIKSVYKNGVYILEEVSIFISVAVEWLLLDFG